MCRQAYAMFLTSPSPRPSPGGRGRSSRPTWSRIFSVVGTADCCRENLPTGRVLLALKRRFPLMTSKLQTFSPRELCTQSRELLERRHPAVGNDNLTRGPAGCRRASRLEGGPPSEWRLPRSCARPLEGGGHQSRTSPVVSFASRPNVGLSLQEAWDRQSLLLRGEGARRAYEGADGMWRSGPEHFAQRFPGHYQPATKNGCDRCATCEARAPGH